MKISWLRLGVVSVSLLSASLFSPKLFEIHFHLPGPSQAQPVENRLPTETTDAPERIGFRRGGFGETVSGVVSRSKSYVLRAKTGQYLSASVTSANGCVTFDIGSRSANFATVAGDNSLAVVNNCGGTSTFTLAVEIR